MSDDGGVMNDLIYLATFGAFFALCAVYVGGCDKL